MELTPNQKMIGGLFAIVALYFLYKRMQEKKMGVMSPSSA